MIHFYFLFIMRYKYNAYDNVQQVNQVSHIMLQAVTSYKRKKIKLQRVI